MEAAIKIQNGEDIAKYLNEHEKTLLEQAKRLDGIGTAISALKDSDDEGGIKALGVQLKELRGVVDTLSSRHATIAENGKAMPISSEDFAAFGLKAVLQAPTSWRAKTNEPWAFEAPEGPVAAFQKACDDLYILGWILKDNSESHEGAMRRTKYYERVFAPARQKVMDVLKLAFNETNAGEGTEWVPRLLSNQVIALIRLENGVADLFSTLEMPTNIFDVPLFLKRMKGFKFAENTSDTGQTKISIGQQSGQSGKMTLTAVGIGSRILTSRALQEDSAVAVLPLATQEIASGLFDAREDAILNGDTAGTHQDNDTAGGSALLPAKSWDGLRKAALARTAKVSQGGRLDTDALWRTGVAAVRQKMGKYARARDCALIVGPQVGFGMVPYCERFVTQYAIGQVATNQLGEIGFKPDGMTFLISEFEREDLASSGVNTSGGPNNTAAAIIVNRRAWFNGQLRQVTIEQLNELYAESDQRALQATARWAFSTAYTSTSENHTGIVYNITE